MVGYVTLGDREIAMAANAASPYVYKNIFHEDFLRKAQEKEPDSDLFQKMGYVMAEQAKAEKFSDLMKLNMDTYYEWLGQFEPMEVLMKSNEIMELYMGQAMTSSVPKNEGD